MRKIATRIKIPCSTFYDNITLTKAKELTWQQVETMIEEAQESVLSVNDKQRQLPHLAYVEKELKHTGVTLHLLWQEYKEAHNNGSQYS